MRGPKPRPIPADRDTPAPSPPRHLDDDEKKEWKRTVGLLANRRILTGEDLPALEILITSIIEYRQARQMVREYGPVVLVDSKAKKSEWCLVETAAWERIRPLLAEFGLTPSARARLNLTEEPVDLNSLIGGP